MSTGTEIRRDSDGNVIGVSKVSDSGSTRTFQSNPGSHYTEHSDGSTYKTGSDGKAQRVDGGGGGGSSGGGSSSGK